MTSFDDMTKMQAKLRYRVASEQLAQLSAKQKAFKPTNLFHIQKCSNVLAPFKSNFALRKITSEVNYVNQS